MPTHKRISSTANSLIKKVLQLQEKSRVRKREGLFIVEGKRELELALAAGFKVESLLYQEDLLCAAEIAALQLPENCNYIRLDQKVYEKIAYRGSTEGVIAMVHEQNLTLNKVLWKRKKPLVMVAEAPEKPGNIGALLRTADAANVDLFIIANPKTDLYNPNIIRASVGCVFTIPVVTASTKDAIAFLQKENISIYAAALQNATNYNVESFTNATAIAVGTEATGLSKPWRDAATKIIQIPMQGKIDSMNVSVAAAILIFEAKRQRNFTQ